MNEALADVELSFGFFFSLCFLSLLPSLPVSPHPTPNSTRVNIPLTETAKNDEVKPQKTLLSILLE